MTVPDTQVVSCTNMVYVYKTTAMPAAISHGYWYLQVACGDCAETETLSIFILSLIVYSSKMTATCW